MIKIRINVSLKFFYFQNLVSYFFVKENTQISFENSHETDRNFSGERFLTIN
jgi:hypothetical protein